MEMKYEVNLADYAISGLEFVGLTGDEHVFSVKESLSFLTLKNPALAFADAVKAGAYNELSDPEYEELLATTRVIAGLFRYGNEEKSLTEMNVMMLLKNAITELVKAHVELRKLQKTKNIYRR